MLGRTDGKVNQIEEELLESFALTPRNVGSLDCVVARCADDNFAQNDKTGVLPNQAAAWPSFTFRNSLFLLVLRHHRLDEIDARLQLLGIADAVQE
jgi:hypothetical protein